MASEAVPGVSAFGVCQLSFSDRCQKCLSKGATRGRVGWGTEELAICVSRSAALFRAAGGFGATSRSSGARSHRDRPPGDAPDTPAGGQRAPRAPSKAGHLLGVNVVRWRRVRCSGRAFRGCAALWLLTGAAPGAIYRGMRPESSSGSVPGDGLRRGPDTLAMRQRSLGLRREAGHLVGVNVATRRRVVDRVSLRRVPAWWLLTGAAPGAIYRGL